VPPGGEGESSPVTDLETVASEVRITGLCTFELSTMDVITLWTVRHAVVDNSRMELCGQRTADGSSGRLPMSIRRLRSRVDELGAAATRCGIYFGSMLADSSADTGFREFSLMSHA
jgi:hypothetical protein